MKTYVLLLINTRRYKQNFKTDNVNIKNCSTLSKVAANMTLCFKTNQIFKINKHPMYLKDIIYSKNDKQ